MIPRLESAEYVEAYKIHVKFADGTAADIDLADEIWGEVFEPLKDLDVFRRFELDTELNTVTWSSGADLAPEFLYEKASQQAEALSERSRAQDLSSRSPTDPRAP
jgi:hypothetical protein